ncbi:S1C family serine protease [Porticoccus sp. Uisw_050_02]|uniref:S1C family serine protease n=1 Tax=Porticoccus sp. Uisw_050_02 TaxID=3230978 RepID=UPI0039ECA800
MKKIYRLINYLFWPTITGLLLAILIFTFFPQWIDDQQQPISIPTPRQTESDSYGVAVKKASPSVVNIYTQKKLPPNSHLSADPLFQRFYNGSNPPKQQRMKSSLGSGVLMTADGYVLTNHHVVDGADQIVLQLQDGREATVIVVGKDPEIDLAVLKINLDNLIPIKLADTDDVQVGDIVLAIGNPFGVGQSVSQGIISATHRKGLGLNIFESFIQTDAAINPGNSGGALIDTKGNLIGIISAILDRTGYATGISFAIPANTALEILEDIIKHGRVIRGWLGVTALQLRPEAAKQLALEPPSGLVITDVYQNSPAFFSGLLPGDIIVRINQIWATDNDRGMNIIANLSPGDSVKLDVLRDGKRKIINAVAGTRPKAN